MDIAIDFDGVLCREAWPVIDASNRHGLVSARVWPSRAAHESEDVVFQAEFVQGEIVAFAPGYYFCR